MNSYNSDLRVGLIGFGGIGQVHAQNLGGVIRGARLAAIADPLLDQASVPSVGQSADRYKDYRDLLERTDLDAIIIAASSTYHAEILRDVMELGRPVFCEKPIAVTAKDSIAIHNAYVDRNIPLQLGFMRRFDPHYLKAKELIDSGAIGTPYHFYGLSRDRVGPPATVVRTSGGFFLDTGVHDFDLARWLLNTEITAVYGRGAVFNHEDYASIPDVDQAHASFRCESNAIGLVELSRDAIYGYEIRTEILGTKGAIQVAPVSATGTVLMVEGQVVRDTYQGYRERFRDAYQNELQDFIDCIRLAKPFKVTGLDGIRATMVGEAAKASMVTGREEVVETILS